MATITPVIETVSKGVIKATWSSLTASSDTVIPVQGSRYPDKTFYISGTYESAAVSIAGCNIATASALGSSFATLSREDGTNATTTASGANIMVVMENPLLIGPIVAGATGGSTFNIIMVARGDV